jgi:hypothetical protein
MIEERDPNAPAAPITARSVRAAPARANDVGVKLSAVRLDQTTKTHPRRPRGPPEQLLLDRLRTGGGH